MREARHGQSVSGLGAAEVSVDPSGGFHKKLDEMDCGLDTVGQALSIPRFARYAWAHVWSS